MFKTYIAGDDITADYHERIKPNSVKVPLLFLLVFYATSFLYKARLRFVIGLFAISMNPLAAIVN
jgi:hypothetical protein